MGPVRELIEKFRHSDGKVKIGAVTGVAAVAAVIALLIGILPAFAKPGDQLGAAVPPMEINYGGGSGGCAFVGSAATKELWINNPMDATITTSDGVTFKIDVAPYDPMAGANNLLVKFTVQTPGYGVYDATVNGGSKSNHYDYDKLGGPGPVATDMDLHAPAKGNGDLYSLSHLNICYDRVFKISGKKFHDRDTDGVHDSSGEAVLSGWTITAFNSDGKGTSATTKADGTYEIKVPQGTYTVCEKSNTSGLPQNGTGFTWSWTQSSLVGYQTWGANCSGFNGYLPKGHTVNLAPDAAGVDFGNHRQVKVTCQANSDVVVTLGGNGPADDPEATVTFPAGCPSVNYTTSFDVGRSNDADAWSQFVVFGGDPGNATQVLRQTIKWDQEPATYYLDGTNTSCMAGTAGCSLRVPTTLVQIVPGIGTLNPMQFCGSSLPSTTTPVCLDTRTIAEGVDASGDGYIQVTDNSKFLGDPGSFR